MHKCWRRIRMRRHKVRVATNGRVCVTERGGSARKRLFFPGWTVVALCFLSLNFSVGIVFAAFGPLVKSISAEYSASRAMASGVLSAASLVLGLLAPSVGRALQKFSARNLMIGGCSLVALGYVLAAYANNLYALYRSAALSMTEPEATEWRL